eukprot:13416346-Alexandrium_andersonii.AAC.1
MHTLRLVTRGQRRQSLSANSSPFSLDRFPEEALVRRLAVLTDQARAKYIPGVLCEPGEDQMATGGPPLRLGLKRKQRTRSSPLPSFLPFSITPFDSCS